MRTDSHRASRRAPRPAPSRRCGDDRGAILAESALITPLFIFIIFGIIEFGGAFRDYLTLSNAASQGTRTAAIQNNSASADWNTLQAIENASRAFPLSQIRRVVIFKASGPTDSVSAACKTGVTGVANVCNVFLPADLAQTSAPNTWLCPGTASQSSNPIAFWCSTSRKVNLSDNSNNGPDYVGIYIEMTHPWITGLFGTSIVMSDTSITKLEPQGA